MAKELLLEIGTEELPAGYVPPAIDSLRELAGNAFREARIACEQIRTFGTPRRLVLRASGLAEKQDDLVQEQQGPAKKVAFDESGKPTKAAQGFAQSRGVSLKDLMLRETPRGEYVFARVFTPGRATAEILPALLSGLIGALSFPKSMRWGSGDLRFARPIRWICALLGTDLVSFSLGELQSGKRTFGHRQLSPGPFDVASADAYWKVMEQAGIIVDQEARRRIIWDGLTASAQQKGGRPLSDEGLLETVTHLVEVPSPLCGTFRERYLSLPREVLTTALSEHQKSFAVVDEKDQLLPLFLAVSNGDPGKAEVILQGLEKVLAARLEDARFFFEEDRKLSLEDRVEMLKAVVFQEELGTVYEKAERIVALAEHLSGQLAVPAAEARTAARAARLCKADLVTLMVAEKEFSKLQGYMGQQYALASGEPKPVAQAIFEHYLPRYADDELPASLPGSLVAIADKVDTIAGCFGVGLIPSGSQDPYALRRGALGVVRILLRHRLKVDLHELVDRAVALLDDRITGDRNSVTGDVVAFFRQRIVGQLEEMGLDHDVVDAVLSADDRVVLDALGRGRALQDLRDQPGFQALVQGAKRVANILRGQDVGGHPDEKLLGEQAEKDLFQASHKVAQKIIKHVSTGNYEAAVEAALDMVAPIDAFFEHIMVMDTNKNLRDNRLRLLMSVRESFLKVADFSKIILGGEEGTPEGINS
jgi:glycyl-tRNA synthetase beta chain